MFIKMQGIHKTFGKQDAAVQALADINLSIEAGEMIAIMGKSGSGKSTLLNILGGLMSADGGSYLFRDTPIDFNQRGALTRFRRDHVGFVVQYFALVDDLRVYDNVALPLRYQGCRQIKRRVYDVLNQLGIQDKAQAYPHELSGGQQQRVAIARAVVKKPDLLLADEPTGALDEKTGASVLEIFHQLHRRGMTVLVVTHDANVASTCDRILHLRDGRIDQINGKQVGSNPF